MQEIKVYMENGGEHTDHFYSPHTHVHFVCILEQLICTEFLTSAKH